MAKKLIAVALIVIGLAYGIYPYFALYRLSNALETDDLAAIKSGVDWPRVRQGLKDDFKAAAVTKTGKGETGNDTSLATSLAIDNLGTAQISPHTLMTVLGAPALEWAFFEGFTSFGAEICGTKCARIRLELEDSQWKVTRIYLSQDLLTGDQMGLSSR